MAAAKKTKECNHCGEQMNSKLIICPFCAGRVKKQVKERQPICPRCDVSLKAHFDEDHGGEYDICSKCGGMWMDRRKFRHATKEANVYNDKKIKGEYVRGPRRNHVRYASCVRCGKMMNRKNFRRISGVIIDSCADHGVWLDIGELEKIRHFIADGGLGKSRDREIQRNREDLQGLAIKVNQTAFTQRMIHFWNPKRWLFSGF